MRDTIYLIADAAGILRMTKRPPSLARDEIGVRVTISIPDNSFRSPIISTSIDVPDDRVIQPVVVAEIEPVPEDPALSLTKEGGDHGAAS